MKATIFRTVTECGGAIKCEETLQVETRPSESIADVDWSKIPVPRSSTMEMISHIPRHQRWDPHPFPRT